MSFEQKLREGIAKAPFRSVEKDILRVVLGEVQLQVARGGRFTDEMGHTIVKKIIVANNENLKYFVPDDPRRSRAVEENSILTSLLPAYLSAEQIEKQLVQDNLVEAVRAAKAEGQAVGLAMTHLKKASLAVEGDVVKQVVIKLRAQ